MCWGCQHIGLLGGGKSEDTYGDARGLGRANVVSGWVNQIYDWFWRWEVALEPREEGLTAESVGWGLVLAIGPVSLSHAPRIICLKQVITCQHVICHSRGRKIIAAIFSYFNYHHNAVTSP